MGTSRSDSDMRKIYKFPVEVKDMQRVSLPIGAEILCVQVVGGFICLYVLCNTDADKEERLFVMYGTGHTMTSLPHRYIGTIQLYNGELVFHVFELTEYEQTIIGGNK